MYTHLNMVKLQIIYVLSCVLIGSNAIIHMCRNQIEISTFHPANTNIPYTSPGITHRLFCAFGYYDPIKRPIILAVCGTDGVWRANPPCKPRQCLNPNPILGGIVSLPLGSMNVGSNTASVICYDGFELHPSLKTSGGQLTCTMTYPNIVKWNSSDILCVPKGWIPPICNNCKEKCS